MERSVPWIEHRSKIRCQPESTYFPSDAHQREIIMLTVSPTSKTPHESQLQSTSLFMIAGVIQRVIHKRSRSHGQMGQRLTEKLKDRIVRIGIQVLYSGVLWPDPARVTRLHHRWGANEAEIFVSNFYPAARGLNPGPHSVNGREWYHSTTAQPSLAYLAPP